MILICFSASCTHTKSWKPFISSFQICLLNAYYVQYTDSSLAVTFRSSRFELEGHCWLEHDPETKDIPLKGHPPNKKWETLHAGFFSSSGVSLCSNFGFSICCYPVYVNLPFSSPVFWFIWSVTLYIQLTAHVFDVSFCHVVILRLSWSELLGSASFGNEAKIKGKGKYSWVPFFPLWNKADLNCILPPLPSFGLLTVSLVFNKQDCQTHQKKTQPMLSFLLSLTLLLLHPLHLITKSCGFLLHQISSCLSTCYIFSSNPSYVYLVVQSFSSSICIMSLSQDPSGLHYYQLNQI